MLKPPSQLIVVVSACLSLALASPLHAASHSDKINTRQTTDCTDLRAGSTPECWDQLDIAGYLNDGTTGWKATTPTCASSTDTKSCCISGEPWSTCFLRLSKGTPGQDCTTINTQSCPFNGAYNLDSSIAAKARYVLTSIVNIHDMFDTCYLGKSSKMDFLWYRTDIFSPAMIMNSGFTDLYDVLNANVLVNNGNIAKALAANLPFWGVRHPNLLSLIALLTTLLDTISLGWWTPRDQYDAQP